MLTNEAKLNFAEFFGINFDLPEREPHQKNELKDLCIADVHFPYHHKDKYEKTINDNLDCTDLYIIGDFFDFYSKSRFTKKRHVSFEEEFRKGFNELKRLCSLFETVYLQIANHDNRFAKYIYDHVPSNLLPFCNTQIVEEILGELPNLEIMKQPVNSHREIGYITQVKNVIFTHLEKSSSDPMKTVIEISKYLEKWRKTFNLKPYDGIMQAHNHTSGKLPYGDLYLYQIPCLIDISSFAFDYVFSGKPVGNPPKLGYIVLNKDEREDKYDLEKTHVTGL